MQISEPGSEGRKVDWEQVKRCLAQIDKSSKDFLYRALLIGGAAVWFYRNRLKLANDPDFTVNFSRGGEAEWLSRDIDFTGVVQDLSCSCGPREYNAPHSG